MLYEALSLKERSLGGLAWHDAVTTGFPGRSLNALARHLEIKPAQLAEAIGIEPQGIKANHALPCYASDALYRLALALQRANVAFKDTARAASWLRNPHNSLGGAAPMTLLLTDAGALEVWALLERVPKKVAKERENALVASEG